jgi:hypothetical protein
MIPEWLAPARRGFGYGDVTIGVASAEPSHLV